MCGGEVGEVLVKEKVGEVLERERGVGEERKCGVKM